MVRIIKRPAFISFLLFLGLVILLFLSLDIVSEKLADMKSPWRLDADYSDYLTLGATSYKSMTGVNSADTVDALRVYKVRQKHSDMYSLSKLFTKDMVYETRDKKVIRELILAGQDIIMHLDCRRRNDEETFHVVALDNTLMRAGYFLVNLCDDNGIKYGIIHPLQKGGGSSVYYNKALIRIFEDDLHLIQESESHPPK